jgi:hypothetical protein
MQAVAAALATGARSAGSTATPPLRCRPVWRPPWRCGSLLRSRWPISCWAGQPARRDGPDRRTGTPDEPDRGLDLHLKMRVWQSEPDPDLPHHPGHAAAGSGETLSKDGVEPTGRRSASFRSKFMYWSSEAGRLSVCLCGAARPGSDHPARPSPRPGLCLQRGEVPCGVEPAKGAAGRSSEVLLVATSRAADGWAAWERHTTRSLPSVSHSRTWPGQGHGSTSSSGQRRPHRGTTPCPPWS